MMHLICICLAFLSAEVPLVSLEQESSRADCCQLRKLIIFHTNRRMQEPTKGSQFFLFKMLHFPSLSWFKKVSLLTHLLNQNPRRRRWAFLGRFFVEHQWNPIYTVAAAALYSTRTSNARTCRDNARSSG